MGDSELGAQDGDLTDPAQVVKAAFDAGRAGDLSRLVSLFAEDCVVALPGETYQGREGVRAWHASRAAGRGPKVRAGEPETVDERHVLVPLNVELSWAEGRQDVRATGIWIVVDGLITAVRAIPGGRRMALSEIARENR